jgi:DNA-directed RNA polymerase subunit RPC12/RpoP
MSAKHVLVCWECGRPGRITEDNQTYCEHCGPGVELVAEVVKEVMKGV